jgi:hypothetical protein
VRWWEEKKVSGWPQRRWEEERRRGSGVARQRNGGGGGGRIRCRTSKKRSGGLAGRGGGSRRRDSQREDIRTECNKRWERPRSPFNKRWERRRGKRADAGGGGAENQVRLVMCMNQEEVAEIITITPPSGFQKNVIGPTVTKATVRLQVAQRYFCKNKR